MKWLLNWIASVIMFYALGYYYQFYSDFSELIDGIDGVAFLLTFLLGLIPASIGVLGTKLLGKFFAKRLEKEEWPALSFSLFLSMVSCIPIMHKIHFILTET